jgi:hypothetical protein
MRYFGAAHIHSGGHFTLISCTDTMCKFQRMRGTKSMTQFDLSSITNFKEAATLSLLLGGTTVKK